jgi:hypothetical protein
MERSRRRQRTQTYFDPTCSIRQITIENRSKNRKRKTEVQRLDIPPFIETSVSETPTSLLQSSTLASGSGSHNRAQAAPYINDEDLDPELAPNPILPSSDAPDFFDIPDNFDDAIPSSDGPGVGSNILLETLNAKSKRIRVSYRIRNLFVDSR